ncbi:Z-DNA-binding protein 1 isoform X3 [Lepidochelys kempii]|uniref:Z-DNA-binding protein 1 isoform X3 n=1 Tax=Lepidochelys kempii TaxID=8472 RepID=UPI003C6F4898
MANAPSSAASQMEQLIWDHLRTAATPKKASEIACACSLKKQEANKVLYKLRKEGKVEKQSVDNKWVVWTDDTEVGCHQKTAQLKSDDTALVPLHQAVNTVTPVKDDHRLSENRYKATNPGANKEAETVIIQHNPTNIIYQGGVQNTISIADSRATQIGNYNSLNLDKKDDSRPTVPSLRAASENADMLPCEVEAKTTTQGVQEIDVTESTLKNTVIGNDNQMNIIMKNFVDSREEHLDQYGTPEKNPFGDILSASSGLSLKISTSRPGERRAPFQRVSINKSQMENVMIGNSNQMSVHEQCGSASLADEETNEEEDVSDSNLISEQSKWTSCDDNSMDQSSDISILCEKLQDVIIGNNNYLNVEETADTERGEGDEDI